MSEGRSVAIIGSGITGLSSAYMLHRDGWRVTLFESEATCGGHTLTDTTSPYPVDLGFQVYNLSTYPHFVGFLECLGVETEPSDMSFACSMDDGKLEWGSHNLDTVFAQRRNIASPSFLLMVRDVVRFGKEAPKVLEPAVAHVYQHMTLGTYLKQQNYSAGFIRNYVLPMCAAVWSVPNAQVMEFPLTMLVRFWVNHHLLDLGQRPIWRVVKGRSRSYVEKVLAVLPDVRTSTPVASVVRAPATAATSHVTITTAAGETSTYDAVVFATHSDVTRALLGEDAEADEAAVLDAIPYNANDIFLHTDEALMPRNKKVWASWNFLGSSGNADTDAVCVSYWVNHLQRLPEGAPQMFVTLNPVSPPAADKVIRRLSLSHPVFSFASMAAQGQVASLQGRRGAYYAGAWCGYGFHEDGIKAAVAVVEAMGGSIPWIPRATSPKVTISEAFFQRCVEGFLKATVKTGYLRIILPNGEELVYGNLNASAAPVVAGEEWRGRPPMRATVRVFNMDFFRKLVVRHDVGVGEAYMEQEFEADDLAAFLAIVAANAANCETMRGKLGILNWVGDKLLLLAHLGRPNTIEGSRRNIEEHYDAGNAMYRTFLDESMTYSSGVHSPGASLYNAQMAKIDAIIAKAEIKASDHVLEIGCGWGSFAIRAATTTGCRVTGLTVSKEQLAEAAGRVKAAGLSDRVNLIFCDYRDCPGAGQYDKVVSIEMIEAVGHEHLRPYFGVICRMLKPGGKAVIQAICMQDERYVGYCNTSDFIREHVFPGGHLPCMGAMVEAARGTGLSVHDSTDIGPHYAITLREWRRQWEAKREEVLALGYSDRFWRKYRFYFAFCEAGFDARYILNLHVVWVKDGSGPPALSLTSTAAAAAVAGSSVGHLHPGSNDVIVDPVTQALLGLYFFLAGMIVRSHSTLWLLPVVSCFSGLAAHVVDRTSHTMLPFYRALTPERQAWWCADFVHLVYSACACLAALVYTMSTPQALLLSHPPPDTTLPSSIIAASTGFFAFHLWVCVRNRLFARTSRAIVQYTLGLVLFGVAAYKGVAVPFLTATLISEAATLPFLIGKMQDLAGTPATSPSRARVLKAEQALLLCLRIIPHAAVALIVTFNPSAFTRLLYYGMCLAGVAYWNWANFRRATILFHPQAKAHAA